MESDMSRLRDVHDADGFVRVLDRICDQTLTTDFWNITLPNDLATSSSISPSQLAYYAALVLLDAKALFSKHKISELLAPEVQANKSAAERHHLFPKGYLRRLGITEVRDTNQIANYALVEWGDNVSISDQAPSDYLPAYKSRFSGSELRQMYYWHALPENWESMDYRAFLERRREMMSVVIADAFRRLQPQTPPEEISDIPLEEIIASGESTEAEFKSTLRKNLHTGQNDPRMESGCLKTIAGFLNAKGGTLIIGVADDGSPIGIEEDGFSSEDKMSLHLANLVKDRIGADFMSLHVHPRFEEYRGKRVMIVECWPSRSPAYVKDGSTEHFYVRAGASTAELTPSQILSYIGRRFA